VATRPVISSAVEPVAEVIIAMRPPTTAMVSERQNAPNNPTAGSTPAMPEKAIASGIIANATTRPERTSLLGLANH
jgi:hypothetical protein